MLTDIPRAHERFARKLKQAWKWQRRGGLWIVDHATVSGRPVLTIGLGAHAPVARLIGLQLLLWSPERGWSKAADLMTRHEADDGVTEVVRHLRSASIAPLVPHPEALAVNYEPPAIYGVIEDPPV